MRLVVKTLVAWPSHRMAPISMSWLMMGLNSTHTTCTKRNWWSLFAEERHQQWLTALALTACISPAAQTGRLSIYSTSRRVWLNLKWSQTHRHLRAPADWTVRKKWKPPTSLIRLKSSQSRTQRADSTSCLVSCHTMVRNSHSVNSHVLTIRLCKSVISTSQTTDWSSSPTRASTIPAPSMV